SRAGAARARDRGGDLRRADVRPGDARPRLLRRRPRLGDHRGRRGRERGCAGRRQYRHGGPQGVPPPQRAQPRLAQRTLYRRDREHGRGAEEEAFLEQVVTELAGGHLTARAAQITAIVAKHGLKAASGDAADRPARLRAALEDLGPTFCKLGQILSTRPDLIPPEVVGELSKLQDDVPPLTEAEVVQVMEEELGVPWEDVFESIEPVPLAAGTIGEVHRAKLETGERVVVKVQRPDAAEEIERDLGLFALFAEKAEGRDALSGLIDIPAVVEHLSPSLRRELDFREEAAHIDRMREVIAPYPRLGVPVVRHELSSRRLLVMDEIKGGPLSNAPAGAARREAAAQLLEAFYRQVLTEGF